MKNIFNKITKALLITLSLSIISTPFIQPQYAFSEEVTTTDTTTSIYIETPIEYQLEVLSNSISSYMEAIVAVIDEQIKDWKLLSDPENYKDFRQIQNNIALGEALNASLVGIIDGIEKSIATRDPEIIYNTYRLIDYYDVLCDAQIESDSKQTVNPISKKEVVL